GPRATRLPKYLAKKATGRFNLFSLEILAREDVTNRLKRFESIRRLRFKVRESGIAEIKEADEDLGRALELAAEASGAKTVEFVLTPRPYARENLSDRLLTILRKVTRRKNFRE